jgi:hypothetical protein
MEKSKRNESEQIFWDENYNIKDKCWMHVSEAFQNKATKRASLKSI